MYVVDDLSCAKSRLPKEAHKPVSSSVTKLFLPLCGFDFEFKCADVNKISTTCKYWSIQKNLNQALRFKNCEQFVILNILYAGNLSNLVKMCFNDAARLTHPGLDTFTEFLSKAFANPPRKECPEVSRFEREITNFALFQIVSTIRCRPQN